jgi:CheY-like chemotaxis protein
MAPPAWFMTQENLAVGSARRAFLRTAPSEIDVPSSSESTARDRVWPAARRTAESPKSTVLLVEAHADTCELYAFWLLMRDFRVAVASSAAHALTVARAEAPDIVVVELMVPGGGPSLIRALRHQPATADALLIVLTTQTSQVLRAEALAAGADVYAVKPCGAPRLGELIALGRHHPAN